MTLYTASSAIRGMKAKSNWWANATPEQRLAQIDGGIECGMSARQVAMASGCENAASLHAFASSYGRQFKQKGGGTNQHLRAYAVRRDRYNYLSGRPVNLWGAPEPQDEFSLDGDDLAPLPTTEEAI